MVVACDDDRSTRVGQLRNAPHGLLEQRFNAGKRKELDFVVAGMNPYETALGQALAERNLEPPRRVRR